MWRIFYWFNIIIAVFGTLNLARGNNSIVGLIEYADFILAIIGLHAFIYKKKLFNKTFWLYFFWINVVYDISWLAYRLSPTDPVLKNLSFLNPGPIIFPPIIVTILSLLNIPFLYAIYQLTRPSKK